MVIDVTEMQGGIKYYSVCADVRETGAKHPRTIAVFDTLDEAALAMKYLRGDRMTNDDQNEARAIIRNADIPAERN